MYSLAALAVLSALAPLGARAHGQIYQVAADGATVAGPNIYYDADKVNSATAIRKMYKASGPAYNLVTDFSDNSKMACEQAGGAPKTISVKAGSSVRIDWVGATSELVGAGGLTSRNPWVHAMGSIIDYLAPCNGACSSTDASQLGWTKIAEEGLDRSTDISDDLRTRMTNKPEKYYPTKEQGGGRWAMARMIEAGSSWNVKIPANLKSGQYILRTDMAALHNPLTSSSTSGPQLYIGCVQLDVTGGGSASLPAGTKAGSLYSASGAFAKYSPYSNVYSFQLPGPALWTGASSGSGDSGSASTSTSKAAPATTAQPTTTSTPKPAATTSTKAAATTTSTKAAAAPPTTAAQPTSTASATTPAPSATRSCKPRAGANKKRAARAKRMHKRRIAADAASH